MRKRNEPMAMAPAAESPIPDEMTKKIAVKSQTARRPAPITADNTGDDDEDDIVLLDEMSIDT